MSIDEESNVRQSRQSNPYATPSKRNGRKLGQVSVAIRRRDVAWRLPSLRPSVPDDWDNDRTSHADRIFHWHRWSRRIRRQPQGMERSTAAFACNDMDGYRSIVFWRGDQYFDRACVRLLDRIGRRRCLAYHAAGELRSRSL